MVIINGCTYAVQFEVQELIENLTRQNAELKKLALTAAEELLTLTYSFDGRANAERIAKELRDRLREQ